MLKIKNDSSQSEVGVLGMRSEILLAIMVVKSVFDKYEKDCVVTSVTDSTHGKHSHHYKGLAADFRTRHLTAADKRQIVLECALALGEEYQVIEHRTHMHVEYDPQ